MKMQQRLKPSVPFYNYKPMILFLQIFSLQRDMLLRPCTILNEGFSNLMIFKPFET